MAQMSNATFQKRLTDVLSAGLRKAGVRARIELEHKPGTRLHHVWVVSNDRDKLRPLEWEALLWRLIHEEFGTEANTRITTIYTVTPAQLKRYRANVAADLMRV